MATWAEYTTVTDVRSTYRGTSATGQDTLFLDLIRSTSRDMEQIAGGRKFYPRVETRYFDKPADRALDLDDDLLVVTTLTNGDATVVAASDYNLYPFNQTPYYQVRLRSTSSVVWQIDSNGDFERAISLLGIWGYHADYGGLAWLENGNTLAAAISSTTATTFTCTTGKARGGDLLKIDSEYLYAESVSTGASDTVTVIRGVNGSTAATHLIAAPVTRWYQPSLEMICRMAVSAYERLKNNPVGESVEVDGYRFETPKDVKKWIASQMAESGFLRPR